MQETTKKCLAMKSWGIIERRRLFTESLHFFFRRKKDVRN